MNYTQTHRHYPGYKLLHFCIVTQYIVTPLQNIDGSKSSPSTPWKLVVIFSVPLCYWKIGNHESLLVCKQQLFLINADLFLRLFFELEMLYCFKRLITVKTWIAGKTCQWQESVKKAQTFFGLESLIIVIAFVSTVISLSSSIKHSQSLCLYFDCIHLQSSV